MTSILDALTPGAPPNTQIHNALAEGTAVLSGNQRVWFTPYVRTVLPLDNYIFWLRASLLSAAQLSQHGLQSGDPIGVDCSMHYASTGSQAEDETIVVRRVEFTSPDEIPAFAAIAPNVMYVATWNAEQPHGAFKFTFSARNSFYFEAKLYHFVGDAVYPVFESQLIDSVSDFDQRVIVSNSLPIWLSLPLGVPWPSPLPAPRFPLYPAFLSTINAEPPYGTVRIRDDDTRALASSPWIGPTGTRSQLCADRVRITLYGLRNDEVMDFVDYVAQFSATTSAIGFMNMPLPRDSQRAQVELTALAQRKIVDYEVSYHQTRVREIVRAVIRSAIPSIVNNPGPPIHPLAIPVN